MCLSFTTRPPRPWQALESKSVGGLWKPLLQNSWVSWSRGGPETSFLASFPGIQMLWLRSHLEKRWMTNPSGCCSFLAPRLEWYQKPLPSCQWVLVFLRFPLLLTTDPSTHPAWGWWPSKLWVLPSWLVPQKIPQGSKRAPGQCWWTFVSSYKVMQLALRVCDGLSSPRL